MAQHWQEILPIDRYIVAAEGLLHEYDRKVLTFLYQPLIGSTCLSLYMTLWAELEENRLWSESSTHHLLMNLMGMNLKDIYEARLKLEGIGLIKTFVKTVDDERSFIYELQPPLNPEQFFLDGMLNIYLFRKIGKNHFARLKRFFTDQQKPKENEFQNVTKSFQDVFASETLGSMQYLQDVSGELKAEEDEQFVGRHEQKGIQIHADTFDFGLLMAGLNESLVPGKALTKKVKEVISNLSFLYNINPIEMKNLILDAITPNNEIDVEDLRKAARNWYQFENNDQYPSLVERTQPPRYRVQLEEPKTKEEMLVRSLETTSPVKVFRDASHGIEPSETELKIIEDVMFKKKLLPGVVNVLIQYVLLKADSKFTKNYVEQIASHWARKEVKTVKEAMELARDEHSKYLSWNEEKKNRKSASKKTIRTELLPDWFDKEPKKEGEEGQKERNPDLEAKKREIEEMLKAIED
ncbi:replication initiation and membrane attachment family protein [Neobacillus cucumis]|uniref:Replication initiation and membrane attachment protein n=1 Tax=Neobacillus cucumis TaxID=1740721 RepID=A0A2N5HAN4_9BACI|nr:replication initiation and membrane attachment family protein [Neobacillus cucumis]PLS02575.1 Replication initiation and membrane attachment protein [Neobacillus cucumis]